MAKKTIITYDDSESYNYQIITPLQLLFEIFKKNTTTSLDSFENNEKIEEKPSGTITRFDKFYRNDD
jgi:hypothetical protein